MGNNLQVAKLTRSFKFKQNSVICIVGANHGVGRELAILYSKRVCRLFLVGSHKEGLEETKVVCTNYGSTVSSLSTDVTQESNCKMVIEQCVEHFGQLDILILASEIKEEFMFELQEGTEVYQ